MVHAMAGDEAEVENVYDEVALEAEAAEVNSAPLFAIKVGKHSLNFL